MTRRTWGFLEAGGEPGAALEWLGRVLNWAAILSFPVLLWAMFR
jgi:hypothetical protein